MQAKPKCGSEEAVEVKYESAAGELCFEFVPLDRLVVWTSHMHRRGCRVVSRRDEPVMRSGHALVVGGAQ
jgi:hypothetical protein